MKWIIAGLSAALITVVTFKMIMIMTIGPLHMKGDFISRYVIISIVAAALAVGVGALSFAAILRYYKEREGWPRG